MRLPTPFMDGDLVRISATGGVIQVVDPSNPEWQRIRWNWPRAPRFSVFTQDVSSSWAQVQKIVWIEDELMPRMTAE